MDFNLINVIVGPNNSGKSSIIQAIQFSISAAQTAKLEKTAHWDKKDGSFTTSIHQTQLIYAPIREVAALARSGRLVRDQEIKIILKDDNELSTGITIRKGRNKNIVIELSGRELGEQLQSIDSPYSIYVPGLAGIQHEEEYKPVSYVRKASARGYANTVFRNIIYLLKNDENDWKQFIDDLHTIFPNIDVMVEFNPEIEEYIDCSINMGSEFNLPIDAAGTGVLQAIQILAYINLYKPKVLLLDEPDAHLHPNNQRILANMLTQIAESRGTQIILSTHSRSLLDEFSQNSKYVKLHWIRNGELVTNIDPNNINLLLELGALDKGDLLRQGKIKCAVLSEDKDDHLLSIILEASGFKKGEYEIWPYKGCTNLDTAIVLSTFITDHAPGTKIIVHIDRDYKYDDEITAIKTQFEDKSNIKCFITKGTDIESYFLSAEHIAALNSDISIDRAKELLDIATENLEKLSVEKFIDQRDIIEKKNKTRNKISLGKISTDANNLYAENKGRYRHGKSVFKNLKNLIRSEFGHNPIIERATVYIKDPELEKIALEICAIQLHIPIKN